MIEDPPIPEGALINGQILITSYIDDDGQMKYYVGVAGDMNVAQVMGLCALGAFSMFRSYEAQYNSHDDDEDEDDDIDE